MFYGVSLYVLSQLLHNPLHGEDISYSFDLLDDRVEVIRITDEDRHVDVGDLVLIRSAGYGCDDRLAL